MSEAGVVSGSTSLTNASDCVQGTLYVTEKLTDQRGHTFAPMRAPADTEFYKYTAGGLPTHTLTGFTQPIGSVIISKPPPPTRRRVRPRF